MADPVSADAPTLGPLYAYVHPKELKDWCHWLAKAQANELGIFRLATMTGVELMASDVFAIEDVFPSSSVEPGDIRLKQFAPGSV